MEAGGVATTDTNHTDTSHYVTRQVPVDAELLENSTARPDRVRTLAAPGAPASLSHLKTVLPDREGHPEHDIRAHYKSGGGFLGRKGAVCTIAMDQAARRMDILRGNAPKAPFYEVSLSEQ